jgi:molecular chaperone DnaK (HSP70)
LNKAVLAVPNTFTPGKISQMKECCRHASPGIKVEHIYEAEAVLMFYLSRHNELNPRPAQRTRAAQSVASRERVIAFDFGGGSANYTYAEINSSDNSTEVTVHQRLGFALGGDHLDTAIARFVWDQVASDPEVKKRGYHPFAEKVSGEEKKMRTDLLRAARNVKERISENVRKEEWDKTIGLTGFRDLGDVFKHCSTVTARTVLESIYVTTLLNELVAGMGELVELCRRTQRWDGVDTLLLTGRSTRFPMVVDRLKSVLDADFQVINFENEAKTCVAVGAAFWGMSQNRIVLSRAPVVFAYYGLARYATLDRSSLQFVPLVEPGARFRNGVCHVQAGRGDYRFNSNRVDLYQLMGADAKAALCDPDKAGRRALLKSFQLNNSDTQVENVVFELRDNDTYRAILKQKGGNEGGDDDLKIKLDIGEDTDKSALWLVDFE